MPKQDKPISVRQVDKDANYNSKAERRLKMMWMQILYDHDKEIKKIDVKDLDPESKEVEKEAVRTKTITDMELVRLANNPSYRDEFRRIVVESIQMYDDALSVDREATDIARNFTISTDAAVIAEWDQKQWGKTITKLTDIRRLWFLALLINGYEFAKMIIRREIRRLFPDRIYHGGSDSGRNKDRIK